MQPEPESDSDTDDEAFNNPGLDDDDVMDAKPAPDAPSSDSDDDLEPIDDDEDESEEDADEGVGETGTANDQEAVPPPVCDSARLFVRNLCFSVTEDELAELFRPYGQVTEVNVPVDDLGRSKGTDPTQSNPSLTSSDVSLQGSPKFSLPTVLLPSVLWKHAMDECSRGV